MSVADPAFTDHDPSTEDEAARRALRTRQLGRLDHLVEAGMELIDGLLIQARGGPAVVDGDVALAYGRISRAVRLAILLQSRLAEEPAPAADAEPEEIIYTWQEPENSRAERTAARKERVERVVEQVAEQERPDREAVERIVCEAAERLDRDDIYGDVLARPVSELVADICRDLGLQPDWDSLARQPWARREAAGGEGGWPLRAALGQLAAVARAGATVDASASVGAAGWDRRGPPPRPLEPPD